MKQYLNHVMRNYGRIYQWNELMNDMKWNRMGSDNERERERVVTMARRRKKLTRK